MARIEFLPQKEIDRVRWDATVARDKSCLPYGLGWWLDEACYRWDGLVIDDYRVVMPLPRGPFWARARVQRPFFTQQCGPFGSVRTEDIEQALAALDSTFTSVSIPITECFNFKKTLDEYNLISRNNFVLNLGTSYKALNAGYHKSLRRKLRRYTNTDSTVMGHLQAISPELNLVTFRANAGKKAGLKPRHYRRAKRLMAAAMRNKNGLSYGYYDDKQTLLATVFLIDYRNRLINLLPTSTPAGYQHDGMARLLDAIFRRHSGPGVIFDFEGSDVTGIARFFKQFGPTLRPYYTFP